MATVNQKVPLAEPGWRARETSGLALTAHSRGAKHCATPLPIAARRARPEGPFARPTSQAGSSLSLLASLPDPSLLLLHPTAWGRSPCCRLRETHPTRDRGLRAPGCVHSDRRSGSIWPAGPAAAFQGHGSVFRTQVAWGGWEAGRTETGKAESPSFLPPHEDPGQATAG